MFADLAVGLSNGAPVDGYVAHVDAQGGFLWRPEPQNPGAPAKR
ncbi:hypothetical protein ACQP2P_20920 [Dactylosporangium sp. CA-139114]